MAHRAVVDQNEEFGSSDPVFTLIDTDGEQYRGTHVIFEGRAEMKYDPEAGIGRRIWIETFEKVILSGPDYLRVFPPVVGG